MQRIGSFILSRKSVLAQIIVILAVVVAGYGFPQRFSTPASAIDQWRSANPALAVWVDRFGLDHIYTTTWFAAILFVFLFTLALSSLEQTRKAMRNTFQSDLSLERNWEGFKGEKDVLLAAAERMKYRPMQQSGGVNRLVRHPWGYWGNVCLHLGMVIILSSSLVILLFEKRGLLHLVEGEIQLPGAPWAVEEKGLFAGEFILPEALRLEKVSEEFWDNDDLKGLSSDISFIDPNGNFKKFSIGINDVLDFRGIRIYQSSFFGKAFYVELFDQQGRVFRTILMIDHPSGRDMPGVKEFNIEGVPYLIRAQYYADAGRKSMKSNDPLLGLMIVEEDKGVRECSLRTGESGSLGPYTARLVHVSKWSQFIFVDDTGMSGIFAGFCIIVVGVFLNYFTPPRELLVREEEEGISFFWRPARFGRFYEDELRQITAPPDKYAS